MFLRFTICLNFILFWFVRPVSSVVLACWRARLSFLSARCKKKKINKNIAAEIKSVKLCKNEFVSHNEWSFYIYIYLDFRQWEVKSSNIKRKQWLLVVCKAQKVGWFFLHFTLEKQVQRLIITKKEVRKVHPAAFTSVKIYVFINLPFFHEII